MLRVRAATLVVVLIAGCSADGNVPTVVVGTAPPATGRVVPPPTLDIEQPGLTPGTGQIDTDWGPIWSEVPVGFPTPPGAQPAEATEPASAAWTVPAAALPNPMEVAQFYVDEFARVGYGGSRDGPLEDGSYTAWASNGYGCDILVTAVPRGGEETLATVLYGAGCPFGWPVD